MQLETFNHKTSELRIRMTLKEMRQTCRAILLNVKGRTFKCAGERNDHMLHYEQVLGKVLDRRESKCSAVLMKYHRKCKGEQVVISPNGSATKNQKH